MLVKIQKNQPVSQPASDGLIWANLQEKLDQIMLKKPEPFDRWFYTFESFVTKYKSVSDYAIQKFKPIAIEFASQDSNGQWRLIIQRFHPKKKLNRISEYVPSDLSNISVRYASMRGLAGEFERMIPEWLNFTPENRDLKSGNLKDLMKHMDPYSFYFVKIFPHNKSKKLPYINCTLSWSKSGKKSSKKGKYKLKIIALERLIDDDLYASLIQWSYLLSKRILKLRWNLSILSGGSYFMVRGYSGHNPYIQYDRSVETVSSLEKYINRKMFPQKTKMKLSLGVQIKYRPKLNAEVGLKIYKFLLKVRKNREKVASFCCVDDSQTWRWKYHFGRAYYVYKKDEMQKNDPKKGLRSFKQPEKCPKFLLQLVKLMKIKDFSPLTHHIGINLYRNDKENEMGASGIEAHNESQKFSSLKTVCFGKDCTLDIQAWLGGSNSLLQLHMKRHLLYEFDMNMLAMITPFKHSIAKKHLLLLPGEWRIAVMVRKIRRSVLKHL